MKVQRLSSTDGFVVFDLDAATTSVGVARLAPKVLQDGAVLLARSVTYAFASFGVAGHGGASAAINASPDDRDQAIKAFVDEVAPLVESGRLRLSAGLGLGPDDLTRLDGTGGGAQPGTAQPGTAQPGTAQPGTAQPDADAAQPGTAQPSTAQHGAELTAAGALAAARVAGPLDWRTAAVVGAGPVPAAASAQLTAAGATLAEGRFDAECDVLFVSGKAGVLDHPTAEGVKARTIVPLSPVPVTARALAVLGRAERIVIPDFLSTAAPLLASHDPGGGDPVQRIRDAAIELADQGTGLWLAAAQRAEANLATWTNEKPFGRPLA